MAELFGAIQRGLGAILSAIYEVIPSYAVAIVLLTILTRVVLLPLTIKQMRSMRAMQRIQPQMKEIQKKYKDLQKKVQDRQELQELRLKQNQEVMALYREAGTSPAGGCLPILAQMPVFIALFSLMRATLFMVAMTASTAAGAPIPADEYSAGEAARTICLPSDASPAGGLSIACETFSEQDEVVETKSFSIGELTETDGKGEPLATGEVDLGWIARCNPVVEVEGDAELFKSFACTSATGTGHLPKDGDLFADVNEGTATILGMHPGCSPRQAQSARGLSQCAGGGQEDTGLGSVLPYYLLVVLIAGTQYVSGKQMMARQQGPQAQQAVMITRIMPLFFGFISLSFPVGLNTYYLAFNLWQMGQQHFTLKKLEAEEAGGTASPAKMGLLERARDKIQGSAARAQADPPAREEQPPEQATPSTQPPQAASKPHPRSRKKRKRKKKR